jgi:hypothetical protein
VAAGSVRLYREHVESRLGDVAPERRAAALDAMAAAMGELVSYLVERRVLAIAAADAGPSEEVSTATG